MIIFFHDHKKGHISSDLTRHYSATFHCGRYCPVRNTYGQKVPARFRGAVLAYCQISSGGHSFSDSVFLASINNSGSFEYRRSSLRTAYIMVINFLPAPPRLQDRHHCRICDLLRECRISEVSLIGPIYQTLPFFTEYTAT